MMAEITDSNSLECIFHEDQASCYCEECNIPVCIKCITSKHQGHKMVDFENFMQKEKNALQKDADKLENEILPTLIKWKEELSSSYEKYEINLQHIMNSMEEENQSFKKEIDRFHFEKRNDIKKIRESQSAVYSSLSKDLETKISDYKEKLSECRDAIEKNSLFEIYDIAKGKEPLLRIGNKHELQEPFVFVPGNIKCIKDNLGKLHVSSVSSVDTTKKLPGAKFCCIMSFAFMCVLLAVIIAYMIDREEFYPSSPIVDIHVPILKPPTLAHMFESPLEEMSSILITKEGDVWLGGYKSSDLVMVDIKGQILKRRNIKIYSYALAVTDNGDIIISPSIHSKIRSVLRLMKDDKQQNICDGDFRFSVGVSVTSSQEILVCTIDGRVLISNSDGNNCKQIYKGSEYYSAWHAVESRNGSIYISDQNKHAILIVSKDGHILSTLTHTTDGRKLGSPSGMVVDTHGNILLADQIHNCIYIVDKNQQMRVLIEPAYGITLPRWLAVDNEKNLWITSLGGTVYVVKYLDF